MDSGLGMIKEKSVLEKIKNSTSSNYNKIKEYKKYLLDDKNFRFPEQFLEIIAREHLGLQYTEDEIQTMRDQFDLKKQEIKEQDLNYLNSI